MTEEDLKTLKNHALSVDDYKDIRIPEDLDKNKALQILIKETKLISDEEKRFFDEKMQQSRYELEKDRIYMSSNLETKKFNKDCEFKEKDLSILKDKNNIERRKLKLQQSIEQSKIELEKLKMDIEQQNSRMLLESQKEERKLRYITLAITTVSGLISVLAPLFVYRKLSYSNLKLIYKDEGRSTQDFKDSVRCIKNLTK